MILRCKGCHGTVWVQPEGANQRLELSCRGCKQRYDLEPHHRERLAGSRIAREARRLAQDHGIDLPGAYSVLLGIMTLEELRAYSSPGKIGAAHLAESADAESDGRNYRYDPAFQAAVEAGFLTARQAMERGRRETHASSLAERHSLPMKLAFAMSDNRMSMVEAMRKRDAARELPLNLAVSVGPSPRTVGLLLVLIVAGALGFALSHLNQPGAETRTLGQAVLMTDSSGRLVQIAGPDPYTVLRTYCAAEAGGPCKALAVVPSSAQGKRTRLGLLRPSGDRKALLAIKIEEDEAFGRWVAGDGERPIAVKSAPKGAEYALRKK